MKTESRIAAGVIVVALTLACCLSAQALPPPPVPSGLNPGEAYQFTFVTAGVTTPASADAADYNAFVTAQAAASTAFDLSGFTWKAIVETPTVLLARDNAPAPAAVYRLDGTRVANPGFFYGGDSSNHLAIMNVDQNLGTYTSGPLGGGYPGGWFRPSVWTGMGDAWLAMGATPLNPCYGLADEICGGCWNAFWYAAGTFAMPVYALSQVVTPPLQPPRAPAGLIPGDTYQFTFVTYGTTYATSSDIAYYNSFATTEAASSTAFDLTGIAWKVVGRTFTMDPWDNAPAPAAVYRLDGTKVANAGDFYNDSVSRLVFMNMDQNLGLFEDGEGAIGSGSLPGGWFQPTVWTGMGSIWPSYDLTLGGSGNEPYYGLADSTDGNWHTAYAAGGATYRMPIYVLSEVLTVGSGGTVIVIK